MVDAIFRACPCIGTLHNTCQTTVLRLGRGWEKITGDDRESRCDLEAGSNCLYNTKAELTKHLLLLLRLQKPYLVYCISCFFLSLAAFLSTLYGLISTDGKGAAHYHGIIEGGTWQTICWGIVAFSMTAEIAVNVLTQGLRQFMKSLWSLFDVSILGLTAFLWLLTRMRQASTVDDERSMVEIEGADLALMALRFILQLSRVFSTFLLSHKVSQMQSNDLNEIPAVPMQT